MLDARALFYALIISLLVSIICGLFINASYLNKLQQIDQFTLQNSIRNVKSGITVLLQEDKSNIELEEITLFDNEDNKITWFKKDWGLFQVAGIRAIAETNTLLDTIEKTMFISNLSENKGSALYLSDNNSPLQLLGNSQIKGKVNLPKAGVKKGSLNGFPFTGQKLIDGTSTHSSLQIPNFNLAPLDDFLQTNLSIKDNWDGETTYQSFFAEPTIIAENNVVLSGDSLEKNFLIIGHQSITIQNAAALNNVILIAPNIYFKSGFSGCVQAYATNQIHIESECQFNYPSVIGLVEEESENTDSDMIIAENVKLDGLVFAVSKTNDRKSLKAKINEQTEIRGQIVIDGYLDFRGTIFGELVTHKFLMETSSSTYENYLFDATIDASKFQYGHLFPFKNRVTNNTVTRWIND